MNTAKTFQTKTSSAAKHRISTKELVLTGMFAAVLAVISQISIPLPTGVPITIQIFGVALIGTVLGWRLGFLATLIYILLGAVGLPVFSNFRGGLQSLLGLTGGYIWGWLIMVVLCGIRPKTGSKLLNTILMFLLPVLGTLIDETIGGLQWAALSGDMSVLGVFSYSIVAFVPKDIILTVIAVITGIPIRKAVLRQ
ncbi:MAG TPA: BioY family transporter [Lachnoclostridium sp.]|jgi:biotin transport system substrate-specific component|uniref:biotin transporter BioY n=1 Tax=Lacrimispora sp. TaxID=2719234 RepID=UPI000EDB9B9A|nr:biotin transporter BioY [Lacrimispora sp.]HCD46776.1 BioY family transporter [Lachnoclostridium sp.]